MGRRSGKSQVVVYLSPDVHRDLRVRAAHGKTSMSELVEQTLRGNRSGSRRALSVGEDPAVAPEVAALIAHGAPLWGGAGATKPPIEKALADGLVLARSHPSVLRILPLVLHRNVAEISWRDLRAAVRKADLDALGMLLDLTAELTGDRLLRRWALELWRAGFGKRAPRPFFASPGGKRYLELAEHRTPAIVRKWGFLMATPLEDFKSALERFAS